MQSITLNTPLGSINTHGVPYTDYLYTSSQSVTLPDDMTGIRLCAISGGGNGGAGGLRGYYTGTQESFNGQGAPGGGSGHIINSAYIPMDGPLTIQVVVGAAGGGTSEITGLPGLAFSADGGANGATGKGGAGNNSNSYNWGNGNPGGSGGAGGGGGTGSNNTNGTYSSAGSGGNGRNSTGGTSNDSGTGGAGGAFDGPSATNGNEAAVTGVNTNARYAFADKTSGVYLAAQGGNGGAQNNSTNAEKANGALPGKDADGAPYAGTGYGRGGRGGAGRGNTTTTRWPGSAGGAGCVVIRVYWEDPFAA
jgi:hypothetical protein